MTEVTDELRERALSIIPAQIHEYEGEPFVIVESWEELSGINEVLNLELAGGVFVGWASVYIETGGQDPFSDLRLGNRRMPDGSVQKSADLYDREVRPPYLVPEGLVKLEDFCDYGFSDEYSTCCECKRVIRTSPDCYAWTPDYWEPDEETKVCGDCVEGDPDDYLEDRVEKALEGRVVSCNLIDPGEYGFGLVARGLEHGLHEHQSDDPRKIARWAKESALQVVFVVSSSQFSQSFDVWVRHEDSSCLDDEKIAEIKDILLESETEYSSYLRREFRQYPTPADLMKQSLQAASAAGERFVKHHGVRTRLTRRSRRWMSSERATCEDKIDAELKRELEQIREALSARETQYRLRCDGCGHEWRTNDEFDDCPECDDCAEFPEVLDEDECEGDKYDLMTPLYIEHIVVRADRSWGGPQDYWGLYLDSDGEIEKVSYHYLNWFDGAERWLSGSQLEPVKEWFEEDARCLMEERC